MRSVFRGFLLSLVAFAVAVSWTSQARADRLADIRTARVKSMGASRKRYAELEAVYSELEEAARLHKKLRCPVIDVTELSVEETAMRIVRIVERARRKTVRA